MFERLTLEEMLSLNPNAYPYEREKIGTVSMTIGSKRITEDFYLGDRIAPYGRLSIALTIGGNVQTFHHSNLERYETRIGIPAWKVSAIAKHRGDADRSIYEYLLSPGCDEAEYGRRTAPTANSMLAYWKSAAKS